MTSAEFSQIAYGITDTTSLYTYGLLNINTASAPVMTALFMGLGVDQSTAQGAAQTLVTYRQQNPNNLNAISWIVDALGNTSPVVTALARRRPRLHHHAKFSIHGGHRGVGPFGRGYRRVKFIFDISEGTPKIIYRQDLSRLGWALGEKARKPGSPRKRNEPDFENQFFETQKADQPARPQPRRQPTRRRRAPPHQRLAATPAVVLGDAHPRTRCYMSHAREELAKAPRMGDNGIY